MRDRTDVDTHEAEKTEVRMYVTVFFHADDQDEVELRERRDQVQAVIEMALEDEDNGIRGFTYPGVEVSVGTR